MSTSRSPAQAAAAPGEPGIGDPYFPDYGNGGYDVSHYDIRLRYHPGADVLTGTTTILARAAQDLSSFNLDFALNVTSIKVNGWSATYARQGDHEVVVTAPRQLAISQADVARGYVDLPEPVRVAVNSNVAQGFALSLTDDGGQVRHAQLRAAGGPAQGA